MKALNFLLLVGLATWWATPSQAQLPLTLDTSFRCTQLVYPPGVTDALPLSDGSVIVTGAFGIPELGPPADLYGWLKLLPNGEIDESWAIEWAGGGIYIHIVHTIMHPVHLHRIGSFKLGVNLITTSRFRGPITHTPA